jgi:hypothetical protein
MGISKRFRFLKRPKFIIPLVMAILIVAALVSTIRNLNAPAVGSFNQTPPSEGEIIDPYGQTGIYTGEHISFKYPPHYKSVPAKLSGDYIEVVDYHTTDSTGKQINVGVAPGSLASDSGISYRRQHKELYRENDSQLGVEFTKLDGTEDTFYIEHSGLLATVSATAPYNNQAGDAVFVASSLKWL